ncbi:site-specific integrase [Actimicrobium sp. CCI2.3]|uniref:site-specific integrase n=1 Tax=Actimicrobium sp. CCI2.3 TaxID=3048616 RepID=UPI002AB4C081|nr:site-specific integrase [Actimicrobium sp. CCI2.3]MDY7574609.1 site-specific integrase [Actimicrobium sp. CCI2.3]MEB0023892.1 site-specific integrase [Actimicrobium sp. CCI2.3]
MSDVIPVTNPGVEQTDVLALSRQVGTVEVEAELAARHRVFLAAATSDNTRRTYRAAIRHFLLWGGVLPADESVVIRYLLAHADSLNPRTLALKMTALSQWHRHQGFPDAASTPTVRKTLTGIGRLHGKPKQKAKALSLEGLERIVTHLASLPSLTARRDSALLQLGFFGGYRRSELVSLRVEDLAWETEGLVITLARSKTDQQGEGIIKAIPFGEELCCPVSALRDWLTRAGITTGPLFRPVSKWQTLGAGALHAGSVNTILAQCATLAGLAAGHEFSSHSLRRGMATSAHRAGADFQDIKRQGGWLHDGTVQGYIEEAGRFESNAAGSLLRKKR